MLFVESKPRGLLLIADPILFNQKEDPIWIDAEIPTSRLIVVLLGLPAGMNCGGAQKLKRGVVKAVTGKSARRRGMLQRATGLSTALRALLLVPLWYELVSQLLCELLPWNNDVCAPHGQSRGWHESDPQFQQHHRPPPLESLFFYVHLYLLEHLRARPRALRRDMSRRSLPCPRENCSPRA